MLAYLSTQVSLHNNIIILHKLWNCTQAGCTCTHKVFFNCSFRIQASVSFSVNYHGMCVITGSLLNCMMVLSSGFWLRSCLLQICWLSDTQYIVDHHSLNITKAPKHHQISPNITKHHKHYSQNITIHHQHWTSPDITKHHKASLTNHHSLNVTKLHSPHITVHKVPTLKITEDHQTLNITEHHQTSPDITKHHQASPHITEHHSLIITH